MKVIVTGATGMVGSGVLLECLESPAVERVLCLGRSPVGRRHAKLAEVVRADLFDLAPVEAELAGYDACFFCLGVSSLGMTEADYTRITHDLTLGIARTLHRLNPGMVFVYVTGVGTDSTEKGASMWARVKGRTENELLALGFRAAYMFRPGFIQPMKGVRTRVRAYQALLTVFSPLWPALRALFPSQVTTTEKIGLAMIHAVQRGYPTPVLAPKDINALAEDVAARPASPP
ncbi:MAG TPA: NAD-dependent epimerase/dehydratase family protein [Anaeromyxobacteraceae bacterium]|nr:NAD-dependent epimerase/dehydratase family protein [Anaeromyxobacteraceae bacterium]